MPDPVGMLGCVVLEEEDPALTPGTGSPKYLFLKASLCSLSWILIDSESILFFLSRSFLSASICNNFVLAITSSCFNKEISVSLISFGAPDVLVFLGFCLLLALEFTKLGASGFNSVEGDASTVDTTEVPTVAAAVVVDVDAGSGALGGGTGTVVMMVGVVPVVDVMVVTDELLGTLVWKDSTLGWANAVAVTVIEFATVDDGQEDLVGELDVTTGAAMADSKLCDIINGSGEIVAPDGLVCPGNEPGGVTDEGEEAGPRISALWAQL